MLRRLAFAVLLFAQTAQYQAAQAQVFSGALSSSLGRTGRAGMPATEAAFLNPALIPLLKDYGMDFHFRDGYVLDGQHKHAWGIGVYDNGEDVIVPGSLNYARLRETGFTRSPVEGELWHAAVGKQYGRNFNVGISGYRLQHDEIDGPGYEQWNYSLGALYMISEALGVAYVIDNLAKPGSEVPLALRQETKQNLGFFGALGELALLRADLTRQEKNNPNHLLQYGIGIETLSNKYLLMRVGYHRDELADLKLWSIGAGFNGPRLKIDYAFQKNQQDASGALHSVDIRVPF